MTDKDYDKLKQIEQAIQAFNSKKLYESSLAFYKALDYTSNKTVRTWYLLVVTNGKDDQKKEQVEMLKDFLAQTGRLPKWNK